MSHVIAAAATGKVPCAIGILRLSGEGCVQVAEKVFRPSAGKPLGELTPRVLHLGTLLDRRGRMLDQVVAVWCQGPRSYTGEDTVELQCHGSPAVLAAGLEALYAAGAEPAQPGEFTKRAFLNGKLDLTAAEAVIDLIDAQTADAAANAAGQLGGALLRRMEPIYDGLADICAHYHAVLDYPDEDIPDFRLQDFSARLGEDVQVLERLLASCERGRVLKSGVKIVLTGKPNVGKSSLLNALAGYERVIVTQIPGTTRDTVEEALRFGSVLARITDTAGIRATGDPVEALGVQRAVQAATEADLAVFVCDGAQPLDEDDRSAMAAAQRCKRSIAVINKQDLPQQVFRVQLPFEVQLPVSARNATGLEALGAYVEQTFRSELPCNGEILTNPRQAHALEAARDALLRARAAMTAGVTPDAVLTDVELAMEALGELIGRTVREDVTQRIFERFCVGK